MKRWLLALLLSAIFVSARADVQGTWGGKWDDTWPVFISVHAGTNPGEYKVTYFWLENLNDAAFSWESHTAKKVGNHYESDLLDFTVDEHGGMLYGRFQNPRMANLVRITPEPTNLSALKSVDLEKSGWKPGAIPAADALTKITGTTTSTGKIPTGGINIYY